MRSISSKHEVRNTQCRIIGDRMMVAPLFAGEARHKIVMSQGSWHDFWTGEVVKGGTDLAVPASTERYRVLSGAEASCPGRMWACFPVLPRHDASRRAFTGMVPCHLRSITVRKSLRRSWGSGRGSEEDAADGYDVYDWKSWDEA